MLDPLRSTATPQAHYRVATHGHDHTVMLDGVRIGASRDHASLCRLLLSNINHEAAAATTDAVVLHAAVASMGERAIVLPGRSGSGKSTLVTALVRSGWSYLTDEAAGLDLVEPTVVPYHRPISLKRGSWDLFPDLTRPIPDGIVPLQPKLVDARRIRPDALGDAARPTVIVFPRYTPEGRHRLTPLGPAIGLVRLTADSFNLQQTGQAGLDALAAAVRRVPIYELDFHDLGAATDCLRPLLDEAA